MSITVDTNALPWSPFRSRTVHVLAVPRSLIQYSVWYRLAEIMSLVEAYRLGCALLLDSPSKTP